MWRWQFRCSEAGDWVTACQVQQTAAQAAAGTAKSHWADGAPSWRQLGGARGSHADDVCNWVNENLAVANLPCSRGASRGSSGGGRQGTSSSRQCKQGGASSALLCNTTTVCPSTHSHYSRSRPPTHPPVCAAEEMMRTTVSTWPLQHPGSGKTRAGRDAGMHRRQSGRAADKTHHQGP